MILHNTYTYERHNGMKYERVRVTKRTLAQVITYELWNYGESAGNGA